VNHRGLGKPLAQEHMGRQEFAGGPISDLAPDGHGEGPRRPAAEPGWARRPWPRRTIPNGEVGNAEDW
jgi:hypothetical protein